VLKVEDQYIVEKSSAGIYKYNSGFHLKIGKMICLRGKWERQEFGDFVGMTLGA
jgi:hypothetical protein